MLIQFFCYRYLWIGSTSLIIARGAEPTSGAWILQTKHDFRELYILK